MPTFSLLNPFFFFFLVIFLILIHQPILTVTTAKVITKNGDINIIAGYDASLSQPPLPPPPQMVKSRITPFKPSIAIVVGFLTTIFSITFLLLLYFKHCRTNTYSNNSRSYPLSRGNSGINRKVIESLPMFRFSSLRGQKKDGLECAVCLNKFDGNEVLRLLPKCKHAFHVECVDTWLDAHSTCPLCRNRVDAEDVLLVDYYGDSFTPRNSDQGKVTNPRISGRHSSAGERGRNSSSLGIISENRKHGRISLDSLKPCWQREKDEQVSENPGKAFRKDGQLPVLGDKRRLEHRIIISATEEVEEGRRRWSDVEAAALLYLRSEMIMGGEGGSCSGSDNGKGVINERSVSEITGLSRYRSNNGRKEEREERVVKRWLDWISQSKEQQKTAVNSVKLSSSDADVAIVVV